MQGKSSRVVMDYLLQRLHGLLQQQQQPGEEREREDDRMSDDVTRTIRPRAPCVACYGRLQ